MNYIFKLSILILIANHTITAFAQTKVTVTFYPKEDDPQISMHIYGHFAAPLGRCIYGGYYVGEDRDITNLDGV